MKFSGSGFGWIAVLSFALNACGDGDGDGNRSGVSDGKQISQLTQTEKQALCEEFAERFEPISEDLKVPTCVVAGIIAEMGGAGSCETVRDDCLKAEGEPTEEADCTMTGDTASTCQLSVGEYRDCLDALAKQTRDLAKLITCDSDLQELESTQTPEKPAACKIVEEKCPELIADNEDFEADPGT